MGVRNSSVRSSLLVLLLITAVIMPYQLVHADSSSVLVAVTHPSLLVIVNAVGGERVNALSLVPLGADPHHYEPPALELMTLLRDVRVVLMTGPSHLPIEERIEELYRHRVSDWILLNYRNYSENGLRMLINPVTGQVNPHGYFLSISGLRSIALSLYKALVALDPEGGDYYESRLKVFLNYLERLSSTIEYLVKDEKTIRVGLVTPILQYACVEAGLEVTYLLLHEHDVPLETKDLLDAINKYGVVYDVLVISDLDFTTYPQVAEELVKRGVRLVVVPLSKLLTTAPELTSLAIALEISTPIITVERENQTTNLHLITVILPLVAIVVLVTYVFMVRTYGASRKRD
ncbi:MAG: zinc ABC transporter substrate-binding protein, partial [Sulfolobales archaeon]